MPRFIPNLSMLPPPQLRLWLELDSTPDHFTLYGGTAFALRLGHRVSVDFDFFSSQSEDVPKLPHEVRNRLLAAVAAVDPASDLPPLIAHSKRVEARKHTS